MNNQVMFEITGGIVETPEKGNVVIPPEKTGRKDISEGELVIKTELTSAKEAAVVMNAKKNGITEIPAGKVAERDEGR